MLDLGTIHKVCAIKFDTFGPPPPSVVCFLYREMIILIKLYKTSPDRRIL